MNLTQLSSFYTTTINDLTLAKALEEHYKINPQFTPWYNCKTVIAKKLIKAHDITHLIFGSDTTFMGETVVQTWAEFGVDINVKFVYRFKYFVDSTARSLIIPKGMFGFMFSNWREVLSLRKQIKAKSKSMTQKWKYFEEEQYMNKTIDEIRAEYGITTLQQKTQD
jgi:hypothetical protein